MLSHYLSCLRLFSYTNNNIIIPSFETQIVLLGSTSRACPGPWEREPFQFFSQPATFRVGCDSSCRYRLLQPTPQPSAILSCRPSHRFSVPLRTWTRILLRDDHYRKRPNGIKRFFLTFRAFPRSLVSFWCLPPARLPPSLRRSCPTETSSIFRDNPYSPSEDGGYRGSSGVQKGILEPD